MCVAALAAAWPATASAQSAFVIGGGLAQECFQLVKRGMGSRLTLDTCTRALDTENLDPRDRAATHVNRGIVALRQRDGARALADIDTALRIRPGLGAAFLNRAAANVLLGRWLAAATDAQTALQMGVEEPWAAHFNRAVALERLGDARGAYAAFLAARDAAPERTEAVAELERFRVMPADPVS